MVENTRTEEVVTYSVRCEGLNKANVAVTSTHASGFNLNSGDTDQMKGQLDLINDPEMRQIHCKIEDVMIPATPDSSSTASMDSDSSDDTSST